MNGVLDAANSKNVTVTSASSDRVCLDVTGAQAPRNVVAMIDNSGADPRKDTVGGTVNSAAVATTCPAGSDALISTGDATGFFVLKPFYVVFN